MSRTRNTGTVAFLTAAVLTFGVLPATGADAIATGPGAAPAGTYMVWGSDSYLDTMDYLHGGQIVFNWADIEPTRGQFDWDSPKGNVSKGLNALLKRYHDSGKLATIQVNSNQKPTWIYSHGILRCGERSIPNYPNNTPWDIPQYWAPNYLPIMREMLTSLADAIRNSPYRDAVLGVRTSPNMIGTEQYRLDDPYVTLDSITGPTCKAQWTLGLAQDVYSKIMQMNYNIFEPDIRPILRQNFFTNMGAANGDPNVYLTEQPGKVRAWVFGTSSDTDHPVSNKNAFLYQWAKSGKAIAYYEPVLNSERFASPVSWNYWRVLMDLDRGVSYIAQYGADLELAQSDPQYRAAIEFGNTYAGYTAAPEKSPGAWVAFSPGQSVTHGNYGMFATQHNHDGTPGGDSATVGLDSSAGAQMIGPATERFGRRARRTDIASGKNTFYIRLDPRFKASLTGMPTINVTYLDQGEGSWVLRWGSGTTDERTVTKRNTGKWTTTRVAVPASALTGALPVSSDITLSALAGDTTFHMVEVARPTGGDTTPPTDVGITAPVPGSIATGTMTVAASAQDEVGVTRVDFYAGTSLIGTAAAPAAGTTMSGSWRIEWDTTVFAEGAVNLTAKAYDAAGNGPAVSSPVGVTVRHADTTAPAPPVGLSAMAGDGEVTLEWTRNSEPDLAEYDVRYRAVSAATWNEIAGIGAAVTTMTIGGLVNGQTYEFQIRATDTAAPANQSAWSPSTPVRAAPSDTTKPTPPTELTVTANTASRVDLRWSPASDNTGVVRYAIWRSVNGESPAWYSFVDSTTTAYSDAGVTANTTYTYFVKARDGAGNVSDPSVPVTVTTPRSKSPRPK